MNMSFAEFKDWCNQRCCDGCWGSYEAMTCMQIGTTIQSLPFWKRKKAWKEIRDEIVVKIIEPTNKLIEER